MTPGCVIMVSIWWCSDGIVVLGSCIACATILYYSGYMIRSNFLTQFLVHFLPLSSIAVQPSTAS